MHGKAKSRQRGLDFLAGGGEMGALMRARRSASPLDRLRLGRCR